MATPFPIWFHFGHLEAPNPLTSFSHFRGSKLTNRKDVPARLLGADLAHFSSHVNDPHLKTATYAEAQWVTRDKKFKLSLTWDASQWVILAEWYGLELLNCSFPSHLAFNEVLQKMAIPFAKALTKNLPRLPLVCLFPAPNQTINMDDFGVELRIPLEARQIPDAYKAFNTLTRSLTYGWLRGDVILHQYQRRFPSYNDALAAYRNNDTGIVSPEPPEHDGEIAGILKTSMYVLHLRLPFTLVPKAWKIFKDLQRETAPTLGPILHFVAPAFINTQGGSFFVRQYWIDYDWTPLNPSLHEQAALEQREPKETVALEECFAQLTMATVSQDAQLESMGLKKNEEEKKEKKKKAYLEEHDDELDHENEDDNPEDLDDETAIPSPCGVPLVDLVKALQACEELSVQIKKDTIRVTNTLTQPPSHTYIAVREPMFEDPLLDELQAVINITTAANHPLGILDEPEINRFAVGSAFGPVVCASRRFGSRFTIPKSALEENGGAVWRDVLIPMMVAATRYAVAPLTALFSASDPDSQPDPSSPWSERDFNRLRDTWSTLFTLCTTGETGLTGEFELIYGDTALWQIRKKTHPVVGSGIEITLTLPKRYESETSCEDQADLLNELEMIIGTPAPHFGGWTRHLHFLTYVCFLPDSMYRHQSIFMNLPLYAMVRARWADIESKRLDLVEG